MDARHGTDGYLPAAMAALSWKRRKISKENEPTVSKQQVILFDIDGTLAHLKGAGRASTKLAMLEVFQTAGNLDNHNFGGKTDWQTLHDLLLVEGFSEADIRGLMPAYEESVARHLTDLLPNYQTERCPGAMEAVQETLRRPHLLPGIVTGNVSTTAPIKLRAAGYDPDWFVIAAYGSEAPERNALSALAVERAAQHLGKSLAPTDVVVIGDTVADIECARAVGAVAVAVTTGYTPREVLTAAKPDYLFDSMMEMFGTVIL